MKQYNGENGIISLTSWKARINSVGLTLYSLLRECPEFHIVLVLSETEFPNKEKDLPDTVNLIADNNFIEILWVKHNYKAFKKVIFTMHKYPNVPVISADDDCIYTCNYANILYTAWLKSSKNNIIRWTHRTNKPIGTQGPCTIYSPENTIHFYKLTMDRLTDSDITKSVDDDFAADTIKLNNIILDDLGMAEFPYKFHTATGALHPEQRHMTCWKDCFI